MTYDNRWPMMFPLDGRPIPDLSSDAFAHAQEIGKSVTERTFTKAFYNAATGKILFTYGSEPDGGPLQIHFRLPGGCAKYGPSQMSDMVEYIKLGTVPRAVKDKWAEMEKKEDEYQKEQARLRFSEETRKNAEDYAAFLSRRRRGMAKVISA